MIVNTNKIKEKKFSKGVPEKKATIMWKLMEKAVGKWEIGTTDNIVESFSFLSNQYNALQTKNLYKGSNIFALSLWKNVLGFEHDGWIPQTQVKNLYNNSLNDKPIKMKKNKGNWDKSIGCPIYVADFYFSNKAKEILRKNGIQVPKIIWDIEKKYPELWKEEKLYHQINKNERWWYSFNVECFENLLGTENEKILKVPTGYKPSTKKPKVKLVTKNDEQFIDDITINMQNKPKVNFGLHRVSSYSPLMDNIKIRPSNEMQNFEFFYETLVHELVHSTGHTNRTNRHEKKAEHTEGLGRKITRSMEELVAEIGMFMSLDRIDEKTKVNNKYFDKKQIHNNVGHYLKSWLSKESDEAKKIEKLMIASELANEGERYIFDPK